jgi:hypothetical protein
MMTDRADIRRNAGHVGLAAVLVLALSGCARDPLPSQGSLLEATVNPVGGCVTESTSGYTLGGEALRNIGSAPVQITAISAINEQNVVLVDTFVIPVPDGHPVGNGPWPPTGPAVQDSSLQSYASLVIPPAAAAPGTSYNLVVHVGKASMLPAGIDGLRIDYTADDRQFFQNISDALQIQRTC